MLFALDLIVTVYQCLAQGQPFYYNSVISGQDLSSVDVSQTVLFTDLTSSTDIYRLRR